MTTAAKIEQVCAKKHDKGIFVDDTVKPALIVHGMNSITGRIEETSTAG
ncbi:MAG: hypothetical protein V8Q39_00285 [Anaerovoracaceae bacterium]